MTHITWRRANASAAAALATGGELALKPLAVAVPEAGGIVPAVGADGRTIGAAGVTGDASGHDEAVALAGIAAAGLLARDQRR